jgi:hypothetical protein
MQHSNHSRADRLAEWAGRLAREILLNPEPQRKRALDETYDDVAALLRAEIRKANPDADDFTIWWLTAEAIFPGVIDRVDRAARRALKRKGATG